MITDLYPPHIGGVEIHVKSLAEELKSRGHQVIVVTLDDTHSTKYENGIQVKRIRGLFQLIPGIYRNSQKKWHLPYSDWFVARGIAKIIEKEQPDLIHVHGWILYSLLLIKLTIPIIVTLHMYGYFCLRSTLLRGQYLCKGPSFRRCNNCIRHDYGFLRAFMGYLGIHKNMKKLASVNKYIAVSSFVKDCYLKYTPLSEEKIVVIPNYYHQTRSDGSETSPDVPNDYIIFVGAMAPYKGVDVLMNAFRQMKTTTKLLIIGYKHQDYKYHGDSTIIIWENIPHHVVQKVIRQCRFAVIPSSCPETSSLVALEAMSNRKAVIASNIGALPEIVTQDVTGLLVEPNDAYKLAEVIKYLLCRPLLATKMGEAGYNKVLANNTADSVIPKMLEVYREVIK